MTQSLERSRGAAGVVVAACGARHRGSPVGSDAALLAALASGLHRSLLVMRSGSWKPKDDAIAGTRVEMIRPVLGRPSTAGPLVRRELRHAPVSVWAEDQDAEGLRGFDRALMTLGKRADFGKVIESVRRNSESKSPSSEAAVVVLTSHPSGLDARGSIFATALASVAGRATRAIVPRGARHIPSAARYLERLGFQSRLEVAEGPSWLSLGRAEAVLLDLEYEGGTRFGPTLLGLAKAMDLPVIDVPGMLAVGARNARHIGQPLVEALNPPSASHAVRVSCPA